MKERLEMIRAKRGLPAPAYSPRFWEELNRPVKGVMERVLDAIQLSLALRRADRLFNKEFESLEKEKVDDSHNKP